MLADIRQLGARAVLPHDRFMQLLSVGDRFILEIQPYRLTHKAYPFGEM